MIKVSIGIIARNEEKHIKKLLLSLINQNFPKDKFEIIIVDGDSSDNTVKATIEALKDSGISYKIIEEGEEAVKKLVEEKGLSKEEAINLRFKYGYFGPCFARNLVIENANKNSKYIAFIDADCVADKYWLKTLYNTIEKYKEDKKVAGAGGPRLIAKTDDKMEMLINSILTSCVASLFNPAFCNRKKIAFVKSIPNYNTIYKKEIIEKEKYDNNLILSDDVELNYRLIKKGYKFVYVPEAKVYHHETNSIKEFLRNMFRYGVNISRVMKKYKSPIRIYTLLTVLLVISPILTILWFLLIKTLEKTIQNSLIEYLIYLPFLFYLIYLFFISLVFAEVLKKTKDLPRSILVFVILPLQHIFYGLGVIKGLLLDNKRVRK